MADDWSGDGAPEPEEESHGESIRAAASPPPELAAALDAARAASTDGTTWDRLEAVAAATQRPDEVVDLYEEVLKKDLPAHQAASLGERAVRFIEEWLGEEAPALGRVLSRVLALDPGADWAFQRLSVVHTVAGRWDDLLELYDRAIDAAKDKERKRVLLDEAANVAKDLAGYPDRAIGYLGRLLELRPTDATLAASLERLLERQERWQDLIELWGRGLSGLPRAEAHPVRLRIARCYLERLEDPNGALAHLQALVREEAEGADLAELLERISQTEGAPAEARRKALALLRSRYEAENRADDVVRTLDTALALADGREAIALRREAGQRLMADEQFAEAMGHYASLLGLEPEAVDARQHLQQLASRLGAHDRLVEAYVAAAARCSTTQVRVSLRLEAAEVRRTVLEDPAGAIELYQMVVEEGEAEPSATLRAGRRVQDLLEAAGRSEELLDVLEMLGEREPEPRERQRALGRAARLAWSLGQGDRSLRLWGRRLEADEADHDALDATVAILEALERWADLVQALRRRAAFPRSEAQRRSDLTAVARIEADRLQDPAAAIETWREIEAAFGENLETVDALSELFTRAERWEELYALLDAAAKRESRHVADVLVRLGKACRDHAEVGERATGYFERALRVVPSEDDAIEALQGLLDAPASRSFAAQILASTYKAALRWKDLVDLTPYRLEDAADDEERARLLWETARVQERELDDPSGALLSVAQAFDLAPSWSFLEVSLRRLAEVSGGWSTAEAALARAANKEKDEGRRVELLVARAAILDEHVGDPEAAAEVWVEAARARPGRADLVDGLVRAASRAGRWDRVALGLLRHCRAVLSVPAEVVAAIESAASESSGWSGLAGALDGVMSEAEDLPPKVGRDLDRLVARWLEDECGDRTAAAEALRRAVGRGDPDDETLRHLARLLQDEPGRELHDTLMRLAAFTVADDDLDALDEASRIAAEQLDDQDAAAAALERLYREASRLFRTGAEASGLEQPEDSALGAIDELTKIYDARGDRERSLELLLDGARLPFPKETVTDLTRRAARIAAGPLGDRARSIMLFRRILEDQPDDAEGIEALSAYFADQGRLEELLPLRHQELALCEDRERRLALRLDVARIVRRLEVGGGRLEALQANLAERPGHVETIEALTEMLGEEDRYGELAEVLEAQCRELEAAESGARAAELWAVVAEVAEVKLGDVDRAIRAHRRVLELASSQTALAALARLHEARGEHAAAARWLERLLRATEAPAERVDVAFRLGKARLESGQRDAAIECLEAALAEVPSAAKVRDLLATLYRESGALEPLAKLLTDAAPTIADPSALRAAALESASIYEELGQGDRSIEVLERAAKALSEDREISRMLAAAYIAASRVDEARGMLEGLIEQFGRRRSPERAAVHLQLARVLRAEGDLEGALNELDQASSMDVRNTQVMSMLGEMAREAGQLDRAEKAFRALLMVLRRQPPGEDSPVGTATVLYELGRLARERGEAGQAEELQVSALSAASQTAVEVRRFTKAMVARGEPELAQQALTMRAESLSEGPELGETLSLLAAVLDAHLDQGEEALAARLRVMGHLPRDEENHARTRELARRISKTDRYVEELQARVARARRQEDSELAAVLLVRLGRVFEEDLGEIDKAADAFARAEELSQDPVPARRALVGVAAARGDVGEERRLLALLLDDERVPSETRIEGRYRLAELLLASPEGGAEGLAALEHALAEDPLYDRAGAILRAATSVAPEDGARLALYGRVARASEQDDLLLDYLEKRAPMPDATLDEVAEAVEVADRLSAETRIEPLLGRAAALAEASPGGLASALWAAVGLAERRKAAGDLDGAIRWMRAAAESAQDEAQSRKLWLDAAAFAAEAGDRESAASLYRGLLEKDPADRTVWEPLLDLLCAIGDADRVSAHVASTIEQLLDKSERNAVRLRHARFLVGIEGREPDAADVLRAILDEEPEHKEAGALLADIFERIGYDEALSDLLRRQLDGAVEAEDRDGVHDLALRLGAQLEKVSREEAMDAYRRGLAVLPDDRDLADRLLALFGPDDDQRERVELMERPLSHEEGEASAALALRLADEWAALDDYDGVRRVLRIGYQLCPEDAEVRRRLESGYREHEEWEPLAALLESEAERVGGGPGSVALLREAARIHKESRRDLPSASEALGRARALAPSDLELLEDLARLRAEAREHDRAIEEVTEVIGELGGGSPGRADLLALRAELFAALDRHEDAVEDLEAAYGTDRARFGERLAAGLEARRAAAFDRGNGEAGRAATLRLVEVLTAAGDRGRARASLSEWLDRAPDDVEGLHLLIDLDEADGRWDAVAVTCSRLVVAESGEAQVEAAMRLADAWEKVGEPEGARPGLEMVFQAQPGAAEVRRRLRSLYSAIGATLELAGLVIAEAQSSEDLEARFSLLRRAGDLYLQSEGGVDLAVSPLEEAARLKPDDHETTVLLVDALIASARHAEAVGVLEGAIGARGNRRSPQLAELQHRMARLAEAAGDREVQLQWLNVALESDRKNGHVAADLAHLAMELGDFESALKALRVVTVGRTESPMSRAEAFLMQGRIAHARSETGPALAWARRAVSEDPNLVEAQEFLKELEG